jgi:hypothetical protein
MPAAQKSINLSAEDSLYHELEEDLYFAKWQKNEPAKKRSFIRKFGK